MKVIKRYPNRLLYDAEVSSFVTSEALRVYVRDDVAFRIVDSRTGSDMTVPVLGQVFLDDIGRYGNRRSVQETLRGFIALGGEFNMEILKKTILASIGVFEITRAKAEEIVDTLIKQGEVVKSKRAEAILELLDKAEQSGRELKDRVTSDIESAIDKMKVVKKKDLDELNRKVDDLAEQVRKMIEKMQCLRKEGSEQTP
jgi:polyhydroxyalkanoate synthesis repressor PhaR